MNSKNKLDADVQHMKHEIDNLNQRLVKFFELFFFRFLQSFLICRLKEHETTEKDLRAELQTTILARKAAEADAENLKLELNSTKLKYV